VATAEVIVLLGATPVFVDIEPDTCNIDAGRIEEKITERTKAIIPVSLYGQPADMDEINVVAARHGHIPVIEDAAQSFGATYKSRKSCNLSTIGCTSFFPSKPLGCYGDGGAIFTSDDAIAQACRELRVHGQSQRYVHTRVGVGGRMDTMQCAVVLAKLERFDWEIEQRQLVARRYDDLIQSRLQGGGNTNTSSVHQDENKLSASLREDENSKSPTLRKDANKLSLSLRGGRQPDVAIQGDHNAIQTVKLRPDRTSVFAQYTILTDNREALQKHLGEAGIPTAVHYPVPLNEQPAYRHFCCPDCTPVASEIAGRVMSLPMHPDLSISMQEQIVGLIRSSG